MKVVVKLFAGARELSGLEEVALDLPAEATVAELRRQLLDACPSLEPLLPHAVFAIDASYATETTVIHEGNEIACIPPVSGG